MVIGICLCCQIRAGNGFPKIMVSGVILPQLPEQIHLIGIQAENGKGIFTGTQPDSFVYIFQCLSVLSHFGIDTAQIGIYMR